MSDPAIRIRRTPPKGLGRVLRLARERAGLSQGQVARELGVQATHVSKLELGQRCPSSAVADLLAVVLDLDAAGTELLAAAAVEDAGRSHPARQGEGPAPATATGP